MDWVISVLKYAPEILGAARAATSWMTGNGSTEATADVAKSVIMIGVKELAGDSCESAIGAGATIAVSSATFDVAASSVTGQNYGMVKDFSNGDYLAVGAKGVSDFSSGYLAYEGNVESKRQKEKVRRQKKNEKALKRLRSATDGAFQIETAGQPPAVAAPEYAGYPLFETIPLEQHLVGSSQAPQQQQYYNTQLTK